MRSFTCSSRGCPSSRPATRYWRRYLAPRSRGSGTRGRSMSCRSSRASTAGSWHGRRSASLRAPGVVHTAPGAGKEDFKLSKQEGLDVIAPSRRLWRLRRRLRLAERQERLRGQRPHLRQPAAEGCPLPPRAVHAPVPRLLEVRHGAGLPARGRMVHIDGRAPIHDRGRGQEGHLDTVVRPRTRARLASQHGRLDDLQEALLGAGAADLQVRVRPLRGDRQRDRAGRARGRGYGAARRPLTAPPLDRRGQDRVQQVAARRSRASRTWATHGWTPASCRSPRWATGTTATTGASGSRAT